MSTLRPGRSKGSQRNVQDAFDNMDADGTGCISKEEAMSWLQKHQSMGEAEAEAFYQRMDRDRDGCVDLNEFDKAWKNLPKPLPGS